VKSVLHFAAAILLAQTALAQEMPIDPLTRWRTGVLVGIQSSLSVCEDRFPQFREQNAAAYAASVFSNAEADQALGNESLATQSSALAPSVDAFRKGKAYLSSLDHSKLEQICLRFPDYVAQESMAIFGPNAARVKGAGLATHPEGR
jgi:hypothetical protein